MIFIPLYFFKITYYMVIIIFSSVIQWLYYIILYYIILYYIISYHIISYHIILYHIISYRWVLLFCKTNSFVPKIILFLSFD